MCELWRALDLGRFLPKRVFDILAKVDKTLTLDGELATRPLGAMRLSGTLQASMLRYSRPFAVSLL